MIDQENPLEGQDQPSSPSKGETPKGRTAEDRIDELLSKVKEGQEDLRKATEKIEDLELRLFQVPTPLPAAPKPEDADVQKAIDFLKSKGKFVDEAYVTRQIQAVQDRNYLESQHNRLEGKYDGSDGRPKYDRAKAEEYMKSHPVYDPEIAYEQVYKDELLDWQVKKLESDRKKKPYVARPSSTSGAEAEDQTITREKVNEWVSNPTPQNRMKYEQNREKILKLMAEGKL